MDNKRIIGVTMANEDIWDGSWMLDNDGGQQEVTPPTPSPDMWDGSWMLDTPETPSQDPLPTTPSKPASLSWWDKFSTFDDPPPTQTSGQMFSAPLSQLADKISPIINVEKAKQTYIDPVLANFDRLNQGVVKGILGNRDTGGGVLPGIWEGLTLGGERKSWGDIVGIDPSQRDQNVLERMARTGSRWALDNTLDPQNFLFGKMGGGKVPIATMAKKALGGDILKRNISESQLFKAFGHDLPEDITLRGGIKSDDVNDLVRRSTYGNSPAEIEEAQRVARAEFKRLNDEVMARKSEDIADGLETGGVRTPTAEEIHQAFELRNKRPFSEEGKGLPENISDWGGAIPPELIPYMDAIQPLKDIRVANRERLIEQQKRMGHEESKMISEEDVIHAPQRLQSELGEKPSNITTSKDPLRKDPSRDIVNWTDADGNVVQIGKFSDKRTGVETIAGSDGSRFSINGVEVFPKQATLYDKMKAFPDLNWSTDILGNFTSATKSDLKKLGYLDLFEGL
jgi:hypothetical protein